MKTIKLLTLITLGFIPSLIFSQAPKGSNTIIVEGTKEQLVNSLIENWFIPHDNGNQVYTEYKFTNIKTVSYSVKIVAKIEANKIILKAYGLMGNKEYIVVNKGMKDSAYEGAFAQMNSVALAINKSLEYK